MSHINGRPQTSLQAEESPVGGGRHFQVLFSTEVLGIILHFTKVSTSFSACANTHVDVLALGSLAAGCAVSISAKLASC